MGTNYPTRDASAKDIAFVNPVPSTSKRDPARGTDDRSRKEQSDPMEEHASSLRVVIGEKFRVAPPVRKAH